MWVQDTYKVFFCLIHCWQTATSLKKNAKWPNWTGPTRGGRGTRGELTTKAYWASSYSVQIPCLWHIMICMTCHLRKRSTTVLWAFDACKQKIHLHWESKMDPNPNHFQVSSNVLHVMFCNLTWRELSLGFKALGSEVRLNRVKWLLHNNPVFYLWQVSQNICGANMYFRLSLTQTFPGVGFFSSLVHIKHHRCSIFLMSIHVFVSLTPPPSFSLSFSIIASCSGFVLLQMWSAVTSMYNVLPGVLPYCARSSIL